MTALIDDGKADPGTHVLLIGVGSYPFLKGGTPGQTFALNMGMDQLSSPPVSVQALARWFTEKRLVVKSGHKVLLEVDGFNNSDRPLRSLEVLCSDATPFSLNDSTGAAIEVERARIPAVTQAVTNWSDRAGRNAENLAVFYFCGHGLAFGEAQNSLLLEDFGGNKLKPMGDAIAFDQMRMGLMRHCAARYQCHLIDACRAPPSKAFLEMFGDESTGDPIVTAGVSRQLRDKTAPVYFATGLASAAYGLTDQPSLFTQGLLLAMRGAASRDRDDHWEVQVPALAEGINKCVASLAFQAQLQYCQPRDTGPELTLHLLQAEPEAVVKILMRDQALLAKTVLAHVQEPSGEMRSDVRTVRDIPMATPWWVRLAPGQYRFEALTADTMQLLNAKRKSVAPPGLEVVL